MRIAQADIFAPVLTVLQVADATEMLAADELCPFGLTAAIFGEEHEAAQLAQRIKVGTVLINDLIVPTADPRVPFGGRRGSGFGVTRGAEGLLEMTAVRTLLVRRGKSIRHFQSTGESHEEMFHGVLGMMHGRGLRDRMEGVRRMIDAARKLR